MTETTKSYIRSSVITFISAFSLVVATHLGEGFMWEEGALAGIIFAGARAGFKALFTLMAGWKA